MSTKRVEGVNFIAGSLWSRSRSRSIFCFFGGWGNLPSGEWEWLTLLQGVRSQEVNMTFHLGGEFFLQGENRRDSVHGVVKFFCREFEVKGLTF